MKNYFITHNTHHTPRSFLWSENIVILNYNKWSKLTLIQIIKEPLNTCSRACSEASYLIIILQCGNGKATTSIAYIYIYKVLALTLLFWECSISLNLATTPTLLLFAISPFFSKAKPSPRTLGAWSLHKYKCLWGVGNKDRVQVFKRELYTHIHLN